MEAPLPTEQEKNILLASVSRSFYLTIRALPKALRHPIRTAYLLARATDTIADTTAIPLVERRTHLQILRRAIAGEIPPQDTLPIAIALTSQQTNPAEKILLTQLQEILLDYQSLPPDDHADVCWVLEQITTGQEEDLTTTHLASEAALERYTWLVAGCVGEFWTRLCARKLPRFATLPTADMLVLGADFGKGLQLVNILRDLPEDRAQGREYLPNIADHDHWITRAHTLLANGWRYVLALRSWRLRFACALPILIGQRTLRLLTSSLPQNQTSKLKIPRSAVRQILLQTALRAPSRRLLNAYWKINDTLASP